MKRIPPPWLPFQKKLAAKLARKRRIKAIGLSPIPKTKAEQRALAASITGSKTG